MNPVRQSAYFFHVCLAALLMVGAAAANATEASVTTSTLPTAPITQTIQNHQVAIPHNTTTATASSFFQVLLGLVLVLALLAVVAWTLKRFNLARISGNTPIKIIGGVAVGNRERVVVVEVADQWIVVGVAPGQVNALSSLARPENVPAQSPTSATQGGENFATWLKQKIDKRNAQ